MQIESPARVRETVPPIGSDELAEGLMLVRASTLKMIRLQLAMERRDRRVALEAVDDLVVLDRRLQDYLADVALPIEQAMFRRELEVERAALAREKLTLAAEVIRGSERSEEPCVCEGAAAPIVEPTPNAAAASSEPWEGFEFEEPNRQVHWWPVAILMLLSAAAAATYWLSSPDDLRAWLAVLTGAVA